jgi:hypothetical protein
VNGDKRLLAGLRPSQFVTFFVLFASGGIVLAGMSAFVGPFAGLDGRWRSIAVVAMVVGFAGLAGLTMQWAAERASAIRRKRRSKAAARAETAQQAAAHDAEALANLPVLDRAESYALAWLLCRETPRFEADIEEETVADLLRMHIVRATPTEGVLAVAASVWAKREDILRALSPEERAAMAGSPAPWR